MKYNDICEFPRPDMDLGVEIQPINQEESQDFNIEDEENNEDMEFNDEK